MHPDSPAAGRRGRSRQTTEQLFFQTFLLHLALFLSLSLFPFLSLDSRQNRWPGEERESSLQTATPPNPTGHIHTFYIIHIRFAAEIRAWKANRETCMQIGERTGRAGCISGPPKAHTRPLELRSWKAFRAEVPFFSKGPCAFSKANKFTFFWLEFHLKAELRD